MRVFYSGHGYEFSETTIYCTLGFLRLESRGALLVPEYKKQCCGSGPKIFLTRIRILLYLAVWRIRIILIQIRIQDVKKFVTDLDPANF